MAPPVFPSLAGLGWSVHKRPTFSTRIVSHVSGREVRSPNFAQTLYEFELNYEALVSGANPALAGAGTSSLQALLGFYLQCRGAYGSFLYVDPSDSSVVNQIVATGDGTTVSFVLQRSVGSFVEPVSFVTGINGISVNGVAQTGWASVTPNVVTLASAPASGAVVTASFSFAYLCRFLDDQQDFENIMSGLWQVKALKFRSVRTL